MKANRQPHDLNPDKDMSEPTTIRLHRCLDRLKGGDVVARRELIDTAYQRLLHLARKHFHRSRRLRGLEQTDDILHGALIRLTRALEVVTPPAVRDFFRLAAVNVRRELIDLARHHFGPEGAAAHEQPQPGDRSSRRLDWVDPNSDADLLTTWTDFHEQIAALPEREREIVELLWYGGLPQQEAAQLLDISVREVQRRWRSAKSLLYDALDGRIPPL